MPDDNWSQSGSPAPAWDNLSGVPTTNCAIGMATTLTLAARGGVADRSHSLSAVWTVFHTGKPITVAAVITAICHGTPIWSGCSGEGLCR